MKQFISSLTAIILICSLTGCGLISQKAAEDDYMVSYSTAVSKDGKRIAYTDLEGLYLYDVEKESVQTLLDFAGDDAGSGTRIEWIKHISFTSDGDTVVYVGYGNSKPVEDGSFNLRIYGYVTVSDNSNSTVSLRCHQSIYLL